MNNRGAQFHLSIIWRSIRLWIIYLSSISYFMQIHFQHFVDKQQLPMVLQTQRRFIQITICYLDGGFFIIVIVFVVSLEAQQRKPLMMGQHFVLLLLFFYIIYVHVLK